MQVQAIAFDSAAQLDAVFARMSEALSQRTAEALAATGTNATPDLKSAVERLVLQEFSKAMKNIITANVTVAGQKYSDNGINAGTEPFNDKLNDDVLKYQTKVYDSVLENATKRKDAPRKAQSALDATVDAWQTTRQRKLEASKEERARLDGKGKASRQYLNATLPNKEETGAMYVNVLETLARIDSATPEETRKGEEAQQVHRDLGQYAAHCV